MKIDERDHKLLAFWAVDCAERVILYFEQNHPQDNRPRQALEAGRAWAHDEIGVTEARTAAFAAHAAARNAEHASARAAARAAGHAAATAHVASHARHVAAYAVTAATIGSNTDASTEHDWQFQKLAKHLQPVVFPDEATT
ncbi:MAG: hypothetical protein H7Z41_09405 [Cytophagales bacterium]|nr:hypothetical protein [Armatimonadota bacterium]